MEIQAYSRNVYYYETDRMNVVSHTNYIRWMEEARVDFLTHAGIPYDKIEETGFMLPVLGVDCTYKHSLTFGDWFSIVGKIAEYNGFKMRITYKIYNKATGILCAEAESRHCFTDMNMKPVRISKANPEIHKAFVKAMDAVIIR